MEIPNKATSVCILGLHTQVIALPSTSGDINYSISVEITLGFLSRIP